MSGLPHFENRITELFGVDVPIANGEIHILSQNDTADGWRVIPVGTWSVNGPATGLGAVTGWLHQPA